MKVLFIPSWEKDNPYQANLACALSQENVSVSFGSFAPLSMVFSGQGRPDVLHIHWQHPFMLSSNWIKTLAKSTLFIGKLMIFRTSGIKIVWTAHNITSHEKQYYSLQLLYSRILARLCNKIIAHSPSAKNEVIKAYGLKDESRVEVVPHGNFIDNYQNTIDTVEARKRLQLSNGDLVFLFFGAIRGYKGVGDLIEAFNRLALPEARLLIAGRVFKSMSKAKDIIANCNGNKNIKLVSDFIPDEQVQIYMNGADIVVFPYKEILTSGAVILAMSFGKPVIAPRIGGIPDVVDDEGSILYDPVDKGGLLTAMMLAVGADLVKMGEHNYRLAKELKWDDIARKTAKIYGE